jgi:hypothetical protein
MRVLEVFKRLGGLTGFGICVEGGSWICGGRGVWGGCRSWPTHDDETVKHGAPGGLSGFGAFVLGDEVPASCFGEVFEVWVGGGELEIQKGTVVDPPSG